MTSPAGGAQVLIAALGPTFDKMSAEIADNKRETVKCHLEMLAAIEQLKIQVSTLTTEVAAAKKKSKTAAEGAVSTTGDKKAKTAAPSATPVTFFKNEFVANPEFRTKYGNAELEKNERATNKSKNDETVVKAVATLCFNTMKKNHSDGLPSLWGEFTAYHKACLEKAQNTPAEAQLTADTGSD